MPIKSTPAPGAEPGWPPTSAPAAPAGTGPGAARRCLDVTASAVALAVLGLPLLALMLLVRLTSPGPALFRQVRLGQGGRPFVIYKLRSMRLNTRGPEITMSRDPPGTPLGPVLRPDS